MRVLLDECIDWRLSRDIAGHEVKTARQMGWSTVSNGELLALAAGQKEGILQGYPDLEPEDVQQSIEYAAWLSEEEVHIG